MRSGLTTFTPMKNWFGTRRIVLYLKIYLKSHT